MKTDLIGKPLGKCSWSSREGITHCSLMREAIGGGGILVPLYLHDPSGRTVPSPKVPCFVEAKQGRGKPKLNLFFRICPWCGEKLS